MRKSTALTSLALVLLGACVRQPTAPADPQNLPAQVSSIAVMPPIATPESDSASPKVQQELAVGKDALRGALTDYFAGHRRVRLLTEDEVAANAPSLTANRLEQALTAGKAVHAEAIMLINLDRYHQRQGSDYAVQSPASVAFEYRLLLTASGQTLCAGSFDETQRSATHNLLAFKTVAKRGFKWIPAADLLREGLQAKLTTCQYLKTVPAATESAPPNNPVVPAPEAKPPALPPAKTIAAPDAANSAPSQEQAAPQPQPASHDDAGPALDQEVKNFLESWRLAWEGTAGPQGDMTRYEALYSADFQAKNQDRAGWLAEKARKDHKKDWIRIELTDIRIQPLNDQTVRVSFSQSYASSNYTATDPKALLLRKNGPRWEILSER